MASPGGLEPPVCGLGNFRGHLCRMKEVTS